MSLLFSEKTLIGVGVGLVLPKALPIVGGLTRGVAKGAVRTYFKVAGGVSSVVHETGDRWHDLVEEVQSERAANRPAGAENEGTGTEEMRKSGGHDEASSHRRLRRKAHAKDEGAKKEHQA